MVYVGGVYGRYRCMVYMVCMYVCVSVVWCMNYVYGMLCCVVCMGVDVACGLVSMVCLCVFVCSVYHVVYM